jgi:hypothetical protein
MWVDKVVAWLRLTQVREREEQARCHVNRGQLKGPACLCGGELGARTGAQEQDQQVVRVEVAGLLMRPNVPGSVDGCGDPLGRGLINEALSDPFGLRIPIDQELARLALNMLLKVFSASTCKDRVGRDVMERLESTATCEVQDVTSPLYNRGLSLLISRPKVDERCAVQDEVNLHAQRMIVISLEP